MGLLSASVTAVTLNIREDPSTDAAIIKQAAQGEAFPVSSTSEGWIKIRFRLIHMDIFVQNMRRSPRFQVKPLMQKEEAAALHSVDKPQEKPAYIISATDDEIHLPLLPAQQWKQEMVPTMSSWPLQAVLSIVSSQSNGDRVFPVSSMQMGSFRRTFRSVRQLSFPGPSKTALKAAKAALSGSNNIGDYLYFLILSEGSPLKIIHPIKLWVITVFIRNKLQVIHNIFYFHFQIHESKKRNRQGQCH